MKIIKSILILLAATVMFGNITVNAQSGNKTIKATFKSLNEDYEYVFETENGKTIVFQEIDSELDILLDEDVAGTKYEITYAEEQIEEYDEDGEPTGKTITNRKIVAINEQ